MSLTKVSYSMITGSPVNVLDFGADNTGATDSTAAIQAAANSLVSGSTLLIAPGTYKIGQITITGKSRITIVAYGAQINLIGNSAGFLINGVCSEITVLGGVLTGDGTNRDGNTATAQIGWTFGNSTGAYVQKVLVQGVSVDSANVGFKFAAGSGGNTNYVKVIDCQSNNNVGLVGGMGYGFQFSQAPYSSIIGCVARNNQRHGIYLAEGRDYVVNACQLVDHRSTVHDGSTRSALSISRSRNVAVTNCLFDNCYDNALVVDVDSQGTTPDNVSIGTTITNCSFLNSQTTDVVIGTSAPNTDGVPTDVIISNCVFVRAANIVSSVSVNSCNGFKFTSNLIDASASTSTNRVFVLVGSVSDTYTKNVEITNNTIYAPYIGIQIPTVTQLGSSSVRILQNNIVAGTAELEFVSTEDVTTNNNLIYNRSNGTNSNRTYSSSGSLVVIPVGGLDVLTMSPSSATTVSNFSGGVQGQKLTLYFTNANTTLKNTNLYLQSAADFVSTAFDSLTLVYLSGAWRETGQSIN